MAFDYITLNGFVTGSGAVSLSGIEFNIGELISQNGPSNSNINFSSLSQLLQRPNGVTPLGIVPNPSLIICAKNSDPNFPSSSSAISIDDLRGSYFVAVRIEVQNNQVDSYSIPTASGKIRITAYGGGLLSSSTTIAVVVGTTQTITTNGGSVEFTGVGSGFHEVRIYPSVDTTGGGMFLKIRTGPLAQGIVYQYRNFQYNMGSGLDTNTVYIGGLNFGGQSTAVYSQGVILLTFGCGCATCGGV